MLRATTIVRKPAVKPEHVADTAWLDHRARRGHHGPVQSHGGLEFMLSLDKAALLNDGDAVRLEDGRLIQVRAAPQSLLEFRAENPARLMRLAWRLGERHIPAELTAEAVYVEEDPAVAELGRGQGCRASPVMRPFHPERADEHVCEHHDHNHGDHRHSDHHEHSHARDHAHARHDHGPACSHDHGVHREH
jgi:urease accessory protein